MATTRKPDEKFFQLVTSSQRLLDIKLLAARRGTTMQAEIIAAIDEHLDLAAATEHEREHHDNGRRHTDNRDRQPSSRS